MITAGLRRLSDVTTEQWVSRITEVSAGDKIMEAKLASICWYDYADFFKADDPHLQVLMKMVRSYKNGVDADQNAVKENLIALGYVQEVAEKRSTIPKSVREKQERAQ